MARDYGSKNTHPIVIEDNFLSDALSCEMRSQFETHFSTPTRQDPKSHQIWNYWNVPNQYTYLRTSPSNVFSTETLNTFLDSLRLYFSKTLGLNGVTLPYLSLYVNGCEQQIHNDSLNGRFAFVYSLTRNTKSTIGGETIIFPEGDLFRRNLNIANAGGGLYHRINSSFNRLVVFDDRLLHGVTRVSGSMDPCEGRIVLHGHIYETGPIVEGDLSLTEIAPFIVKAMDVLLSSCSAALTSCTGILVLEFFIGTDGRVYDVTTLTNRIFALLGDDNSSENIYKVAASCLQNQRFPASQGVTKVILPISVGGRLGLYS